MCPFRIVIKRPAEDWLRRQPSEIQKRFAVKIRKLKECYTGGGTDFNPVLERFNKSDYRELIVITDGLGHYEMDNLIKANKRKLTWVITDGGCKLPKGEIIRIKKD
jgi:predicted metal-dependent peptidase